VDVHGPDFHGEQIDIFSNNQCEPRASTDDSIYYADMPEAQPGPRPPNNQLNQRTHGQAHRHMSVDDHGENLPP